MRAFFCTLNSLYISMDNHQTLKHFYILFSRKKSSKEETSAWRDKCCTNE